MGKCCFKCGRAGQVSRERQVSLFNIPSKSGSKWRTEFIKRLGIVGIQEINDMDIQICSRHFKADEREWVNDKWQLKENALPMEKDVVDDNDDDDEYDEVKPELVYLRYEGEETELVMDSSPKTEEARELAPLERLVEYVSVYRDDEEGEDNFDVKTESVDGESEEEGSELYESASNSEGNGSQVISVVSSEGNLQIEPMMPFFLTSSPVFTILNENNEVGETIILQIENSEDKKDPVSESDLICELEKFLCKSVGSSIAGKYSCDICTDESYNCINCLKSHYETLHISNSLTQYKCKFSHHISRSLVCPVCELTFTNRNDTMDHYITHSVACDICGSGFDRQSHLTEHYKLSHKKGDYQATFECELCKSVYQYPAILSKHYQTFHRMILCHVCKLRFGSVTELQDHEKVHNQMLNVLPFACSKCDKAFAKISDIAVHIRQDHKKHDIVQSEDACSADKVELRPTQKKLKVRK